MYSGVTNPIENHSSMILSLLSISYIFEYGVHCLESAGTGPVILNLVPLICFNLILLWPYYCNPELLVQIYCTSGLMVFLVSVFGVATWWLMLVYSITVGFSPKLYCWAHVTTLGNPFDTMKNFCSYIQCSHLNLLTCLKGSDAFRFFFGRNARER